MEMIKVCLPNDSKSEGIGGGWTFRRNLTNSSTFKIVDTIEESDICLVCGITMITGSTFDRIKQLNKKVVIRLDGIPEPWRNPKIDIAGRLQRWCELSDGIVYQSHFTKRLIGDALHMDDIRVPSRVIINGTDQSVFKPDGETVSLPNGKKILTVLWRQDPNKRWDEVLMRFREHSIKNPDDYIIMVGDFPNSEYNFGFIFNEKYMHFGKANEYEMAKIMRSCDEFWFPSFADPCPNTLIEALSCGVEVKHVPEFGGAKEILDVANAYGIEYLSSKRMAEDYYWFFKKVYEAKN